MPTSVHIPPPLLEAVDRSARRLRVSRNRFIVRVLEKEVMGPTTWSPDFFDRLGRIDPDTVAAVDELLQGVRSHRTRKRPPRL